ncbi:LAME_0H18514g1_1 [Lachancea meyersii CBS 8951]|uniref:LAME_0H18514g1_1 n=1 Tax=Lachancea meyersii CBS 8951 TaxID=1266667 RepID=A0A1G4KIZ0_9SACH|nr:LAME_0H18514g1_1 [Lachancea meyersii CBS 8951]
MSDLDSYVPMIDAILSVSNPDEVSAKRIRKAVQELFSVNLEAQRKAVNALIVDRFNHIQEARTNISSEDLAGKDAAIAKSLSKKLKSGKKKSQDGSAVSKPKKKRKTSENGNALSQNKMILSPELQELVKEPEMARTQVVKKVWEYIREHDLQNPSDRREIMCDDKMKPIFGAKTTMFALNKSLSKHIYSRSEVLEQKSASEGPKKSPEPSRNPSSSSDST